MKRDAKEPEFALYCKQSEVQSTYEFPWACGFASLTTCVRLLGDRRTRCSDFVARARAKGIAPRRGLTTDDAIQLAAALGYLAVRNPAPTRYSPQEFRRWLAAQFRNRHPVMVSVATAQDFAGNHWWASYSDLDDDPGSIWIMDPIEEDIPFEALGWKEFFSFATVDDESSSEGPGFQSFDALSIRPQRAGLMPVPPSNALINFLNREPEVNYSAEFAAACLVDNYYQILKESPRKGRATGRGSVELCRLLAQGGPLITKLQPWRAYLDETDMETVRGILADIEMFDGHRVPADSVATVVSELALLLVLTTRALME